MKKELIGFSVCIMLFTIAFVPNIAAEEKITDEDIETSNQPLSTSYGWLYLGPWFLPWAFGELFYKTKIGFPFGGIALDKESFDTLKITKKRVSGLVHFLNMGNPVYRGKVDDGDGGVIDASFVHWYWVYGFGTFDVTCTWSFDGDEESAVFTATVRGLKVSWENWP